MKAVILAGGLGTRLSEETHSRPKPMVEIGGMPILWHIMKIFDFYGINEFIICCGYKGFFIKEYFNNYHLRNTDVTFDLENNSTSVLRNTKENWSVTCVDTGDNTLTGGRLKQIKDFLEPDESFLFTYGDGVGNIDINSLVNFHKSHKKMATVTAVNPPGRFGILNIDEDDLVLYSGGGGANSGILSAEKDKIQLSRLRPKSANAGFSKAFVDKRRSVVE